MVQWTAAATTAPDTWGISGPAFLGYYALGALLALGLALACRRAVLNRITPASDPNGPLRPTELAMLIDEKRPVLAGLAHLRGRHLIDSTGRSIRTPTAAEMSALDPLSVSLHAHLIRTDRRNIRDLRAAGIFAVVKMRADLRARGYLSGPRQRKALILATLPLDLLLVIGLARLVAGASTHHSVGFLVVALIVTFIAAALMLRPPRVARRGRDTLAAEQERNLYLRPGNSPAYSSYGPDSAALAVALFGGAALWMMDPELAGAVSMAAVPVGGGGSGYSCSTDSGSSGDSGGGSSCSSSSCGSSCGGGCGG
ncbi:TIGR04222 domain-containing membrane protein [Nocardia seriolae]|uniref:TIGR04222 domain-containing membrane protein n=1 Tax=Nocardia seriolae TaxID=37332 RepID=A0ABC9YNG1_9NOCA|nr:TIGR04222 domain-containing membrane protein [Nocardia seriolae]BEK99368.1 hypothetical protein NSER024013_72740 [Nocardia seriolae]GAM44931.1 hypothetical protein NS07_v2contig00009-0089 [Nocardia seriolae]GAP26878.1 hypothetical protein NSK11_contig00011-0015 [Nocardia seriolae]